MAFRSYIKIPRELFASEEWGVKRHFSRFEAQIDLLRSVAYADGFVVHCMTRDVVLRRGQMLTSQRDLAERWGWSAATVNRYLQMLRNTRRNSIRIQIETAIETGKTLITICDYDKWDLELCEGETPGETGIETHSETPHETHIELNSSIKENNIHTQVDTEKGVVGGNAAELLFWIGTRFPRIAAMAEPFTEKQVVWMLRKYSLVDIKRLVAQMDNKEAYSNKSAYSTFSGFAGRDFELRERGTMKLYTFEELCDLTDRNGKYSTDDFERLMIDSRPMWKFKAKPTEQHQTKNYL